MLKTQNLTYSYNNDDEDTAPVPVLMGVDIEIEKGEFVAILGHNGSGKSTLAKHFNAILLPSGGTVYVDEMDTSNEELLFELRRRVGMVFQNPDNQIVATIVEEDVAFAPENLGLPQPEIRERVDWALKTVGMYDKRFEAPHLLSGGQKQRIAIAGVLAMKPKYIIMDEPTAMLDPTGRAEVMATIKELNQHQGMTVVLITHYMEEAAMASRVVVMQDGNILMQGTPKEIFVRVEELKATGLDIPQTTELMYELRKTGLGVELGCLTIDECIEEIMKFI